MMRTWKAQQPKAKAGEIDYADFKEFGENITVGAVLNQRVAPGKAWQRYLHRRAGVERPPSYIPRRSIRGFSQQRPSCDYYW